MATQCALATQIEQRLLARNPLFESFFAREAQRLAEACHEMSDRFLRGGRLPAFGRGPYATDAQNVSVEFVHPVIVGKRALPALDLSISFEAWLQALATADDIVMGFGPPEGDREVGAALEIARARKAMTFALPGERGSYAIGPESRPGCASSPFAKATEGASLRRAFRQTCPYARIVCGSFSTPPARACIIPTPTAPTAARATQ
jgi:phosphoheptose isomerase